MPRPPLPPPALGKSACCSESTLLRFLPGSSSAAASLVAPSHPILGSRAVPETATRTAGQGPPEAPDEFGKPRQSDMRAKVIRTPEVDGSSSSVPDFNFSLSSSPSEEEEGEPSQ